jgi:excisionase family DNA binding protein
MRTHRTLDGAPLDLTGLSLHEKTFLRSLQRMAQTGMSYFEIERTAIGPGSPALEGRDIATRAGIEEGLFLAPEHAEEAGKIPADGSLISVTQAAFLIGISRTAVHKAIAEKRLDASRFGNVILVKRAAAEAYRSRANKPGSPPTPARKTPPPRPQRDPRAAPTAHVMAARPRH